MDYYRQETGWENCLVASTVNFFKEWKNDLAGGSKFPEGKAKRHEELLPIKEMTT